MHRNGLDSTKKSYKNDILLILFSDYWYWCLCFYAASGKERSRGKVSVNNKEYGTYSLDKNQTVTIGEDDWENILIIKDGKASMAKADCPDKICVNHAAISKRRDHCLSSS